MPTTIALTPRFESFIREMLESGSYNNASEVVRDGLRLLEQRRREDAAKLAALRRASCAGFAQIDSGDFEEISAREIAAHVLRLARPVGKRVRRAKSRR